MRDTSILLAVALMAWAGCQSKPTTEPSPSAAPSQAEAPPATAAPTSAAVAIALGERLFDDERFSFTWAGPAGLREAPSETRAMSCRTCHLRQAVDDPKRSRSHADFEARTPIPKRSDGRTVTLRNTQPISDLGESRHVPNLLLHHDGEFSTHEGLVVATLLGRNMGWLSDEGDRALSHVAAVIRAPSSDDQLSYSQLLSGQPVNGQAIPKRYRLDVATAADHAIIARIADVITVYMRDQRSRRISPYDRFLATNGLPDAPNSEETDAEYTLRLKAAVDALAAPKLVDDGEMKNHQGQRDVFGATELHGLKVFLGTNPTGMSQGQCATCHTPPLFTDFGFHNIGISQIEYEDIHGNGRFFTLQIPSYEDQQKQSDQYLPANAAHPNRPGPYFRVPQKDQPKWADLGVWNVVHNPAIKQETRDRIISAIVRHNPEATTPAAQLKASVAAFRTPMLRNLGHSDPYMHHGGFNALEDVIGHYRSISQLSRIHAVQNPDRALRNIRLTDRDVIALAAFLKSLNEDSGS